MSVKIGFIMIFKGDRLNDRAMKGLSEELYSFLETLMNVISGKYNFMFTALSVQTLLIEVAVYD